MGGRRKRAAHPWARGASSVPSEPVPRLGPRPARFRTGGPATVPRRSRRLDPPQTVPYASARLPAPSNRRPDLPCQDGFRSLRRVPKSSFTLASGFRPGQVGLGALAPESGRLGNEDRVREEHEYASGGTVGPSQSRGPRHDKGRCCSRNTGADDRCDRRAGRAPSGPKGGDTCNYDTAAWSVSSGETKARAKWSTC